MKRFIYILVTIFLVGFIGVLNVEAASLSTSVSNVDVSSASKDNTFVLTFAGATDSEWRLSYDSEIYVVGNPPISNGVLSVAEGSVTFAVKKGLSLTENKTVNIKLKNENSGEEISTSVVINKNTTTTTSSTTTTTKPTTTTQKKSNNANLRSLEIKVIEKINTQGKKEEVTTSTKPATTTTTKKEEATTQIVELVNYTPNFKPDVYEYSATVASNVKKISINATMEDAKANMVISDNASKELKAGENNKITITVTAEDGSKKAYVINIKREALKSDATLKGLIIEEAPEFKFEPDKFSYRVKIGKNIDKLTISYELSETNSKAEIMGNEDIEDGSKVKILVTAEDGTKKEYILNIVKDVVTTTATIEKVEPEKNPLIIMGLSVIAFALIGAIIYVAKK